MDAHGRFAGFTLLELLLVMVIIGILASTVVIGFTDAGQRRHVQTEAERLAQTIELARNQALRGNEIWGLVVTDNTYGFKRYGKNATWIGVGKRPFSGWTAEHDVAFKVVTLFDGHGGAEDQRQRRPPVKDEDGNEDEEAPGPIIIIHPGGEITPFGIVVSDGNTPAWVARSDGITRVRAVAGNAIETMDRRLAALLASMR